MLTFVKESLMNDEGKQDVLTSGDDVLQEVNLEVNGRDLDSRSNQ